MSSASSVQPAGRAVPPQVFAFIVVGLLAFSFASIFIRYAQAAGMPSLLIAAGRLTIAAALLTPFALAQHLDALRALRRRDFALAALSGMLLALHFASWIASLEYTSVLISVVLVTTSPLWVALLEVVFLRVRLPRIVMVGLVVAFVGGVLIGTSGGGASSAAPNPMLGGVLALVGAVAMAVYLVIGRSLRSRLTLIPYIWLVYGCAALTLLVVVFAAGTPITGYSADGYLWIVLLALAPQLLGHTSLNYALRYISATYVSFVTLLEPVGSALIALIVFRELPTPVQILGSVAILGGVVLASVRRPADEG